MITIFGPYHGFHGSFEVSEEDGVLFGRLLWITDTILYEGNTYPELADAFKEAVDDYIETCTRHEIEPKKPFSGTLNVRPGPELHESVAVAAKKEGVSLNKWISHAMSEQLQKR